MPSTGSVIACVYGKRLLRRAGKLACIPRNSQCAKRVQRIANLRLFLGGVSMLAVPLVSAPLCIALHWDDMQKLQEMVFSVCFRIKRNVYTRGYASAAWDGTKCY